MPVKCGPELVSAAQRCLLWGPCSLPVGQLSTRRRAPLRKPWVPPRELEYNMVSASLVKNRDLCGHGALKQKFHTRLHGHRGLGVGTFHIQEVPLPSLAQQSQSRGHCDCLRPRGGWEPMGVTRSPQGRGRG